MTENQIPLWNTPLEYIKWNRAQMGRYDLEKDEPILYDQNENFMFPPMMPVEQSIQHQCRKCREQTRTLLALVKEGRVEEARKYVDISNYDRRTNKLSNICTPHCTWYMYFEEKRKRAFQKYDTKRDVILDEEIDNL